MICNPIDSIIVTHNTVEGTMHCIGRLLCLIRLTLNCCTDARSTWNDRWMALFNRNHWPWDLCLLASKIKLPPLQVLGRWFWSLSLNRTSHFNNCLGVVLSISSHMYLLLIVTLMKIFCLSDIHLRCSYPIASLPSSLPVFWQCICNQSLAPTPHW